MRIMRLVAAATFVAVTLGSGVAMAATPELSTTDQLKTRRYVSAGDRAYVMGFEDGSFYAQGWHVTGEMGGVWSQPLKLVDGVWFGVDGSWLAAGDEVHERLGLHADGLPRRRRAEGQPHRLRARRPPRRAVRPAAAEPRRRGQDRRRQGRRALRGHVALPVGVDDAERGRLQPRRHRRLTRAARSSSTTPARRIPTPARTTGSRSSARTRRRTAARPGPGHWGSQTAAGDVHGREPVLLRRGPVRQGHRRPAALPRDGPGRRRADAVDRRRRLRQGRGSGARRAAQRRWPTPTRALRREDRRRASASASYTQLSLPGDRRLARRHRLGQAEHPRPHAARGRPADPRRRRGQGLSGRRSAPSRTPAGSAPATRTTRGSSPPTPSTRRSRP